METAVNELYQLQEVVAKIHLNLDQMRDVHGSEVDILVIYSRDPDDPNCITTRVRLPKIPARELVEPESRTTTTVTPPRPGKQQPSNQPTFFDDTPVPTGESIPAAPIEQSDSNDTTFQESPVLEFPFEGFVVSRKNDGDIKRCRLSPTEWWAMKIIAEADGEPVHIDTLLNDVPEWDEHTEQNCVHTALSSAHAKFKQAGIDWHAETHTDHPDVYVTIQPGPPSGKRRKRRR